MKAPSWLLPPKPGRLLVLFGILLAIVGVDKIRRWWKPTHTHETAHYHIQSSAQTNQSVETGKRMEMLYSAYLEFFSTVPGVHESHAMLQLKLYRDRNEFKRCNRVGWAEAFYRAPYCHAYFSPEEVNPHQWMLHEGVHQLNHEVARLELAQWADEGVAEYFSTSRLRNGRLDVGKVDRNTYPVWWLDELPLTGDLERDLKSGTIIPLRAILAGRGGPSMNQNFNLYYLHWWSFVHLLFEAENGTYRAGTISVLREGATLASVEKHIAPVERLQAEWYRHLCQLQWDLFRIGKPPVSLDGRRDAHRSEAPTSPSPQPTRHDPPGER
jgi:hypothetical protein